MFGQSTYQNHFESLPGFRVVMSVDGINGRSIQTLLRGENDSKQSNEIQAVYHFYIIARLKNVVASVHF